MNPVNVFIIILLITIIHRYSLLLFLIYGRPIELFLVPASASQFSVTKTSVYPVCRMVHIKDSLLLIRKNTQYKVVAAGFLSHYLSGP